MVVRVDVQAMPARIALAEPDDFGSFKVVVIGGERAASADSAIARIGRRADDSEHAYITVSAVEALAGDRASDEDWAASLRSMVDSARKHGWAASDGAIRAHIEWER
jgi:hypothetical protein